MLIFKMLETKVLGKLNKISCYGRNKRHIGCSSKSANQGNIIKMVSEIGPRHSCEMAIKKHIPDDVIDKRIEHIIKEDIIDEVDNPSHLSLERFVSDENAINKELFEVMKYELNRFNSFTDRWPLSYVSPKELADNGFFYLQSEDQVQCAFCGIVIDDWNVGDKPLKEHMKKAPKCPFLLTLNVGNVPMNKSKPQGLKLNKYVQNVSLRESAFHKPRRPQMSELKSRLASYKGWPLIMLSSKQLAECGFYYTGVLDVVTCFYCNGSLGNWEINDDPLTEHEKFFPHCGYIHFIKSQMKSESNKSLITSPSMIQPHNYTDVKQKNRIESIQNEVLRQACEIFPTLKVQKVAVEHFKSTGQHFKSLHDLCEAVLEYEKKQELTKLKNSMPASEHKSVDVPLNIHNSTTNVTETVKKDICKICMDEEMNVVFVPCSHLVSCDKCAVKIFNCPLCRTPVTNKMKVFRG